ncbi:MAG TPA: FAD-binding protein [Candidatus Limnocylindrales bacterium]|jgi:xylitol oxidase
MKNWAGNIAYRARRMEEPRSVAQVQELVRAATSIRALGSRHAFNDLADTTGILLSTAGLPRRIEIDQAASTVTVDGALRYGDLCGPLDAAGLALHNLASLPHISIAGACATATHGSGDRLGTLSTAVIRIDLVQADGELVSVERPPQSRGIDGFEGVVVALGALGVVTRLTLTVEPSYTMRQDVFDQLPIDAFIEHFDEIASAGDSVSFFTSWGDGAIDQVWVKRRARVESAGRQLDDLYGASLAPSPRHPIPGLSPAACTEQLGKTGPWQDRLPHFRMDHTPSSGAELQSEYFVGRPDAVPAFVALERLRDRVAPLVQVSEIRTVAADDLWLSPAYRRPSVTFHFTWKPDWPAVRELLPVIESALAPFQPRPHWAKLFTMPAEAVRAGYERLPAFVDLARRHDPDGKFANDYLKRMIFGTGRST